MTVDKKVRLFVLIIGCLLVPEASWANESYLAKVGEKFGLGVMNVATGWMEIPKTVYVTTSNEGLAYGVSAGFFKGIAHTFGRTLGGTLEIATFIIPTKPMINPPMIWENFDKETTYSSTWEMYDTQ